MTKRRRVPEMSLLYTSVLILRVGKGNVDLSSFLHEVEVYVRSGLPSEAHSCPLDRRAFGPNVRPSKLNEIINEDRPRSWNIDVRDRKSLSKAVS